MHVLHDKLDGSGCFFLDSSSKETMIEPPAPYEEVSALVQAHAHAQQAQEKRKDDQDGNEEHRQGQLQLELEQATCTSSTRKIWISGKNTHPHPFFAWQTLRIMHVLHDNDKLDGDGCFFLDIGRRFSI